MARPAGLEPATVRLEGGCSIRLSYGRVRDAFTACASVRPGLLTAVREVIGIGPRDSLGFARFDQLVGNVVAAGKVNRLFTRIEMDPDLAIGVRCGRPAHEIVGLDHPRLEFEHPDFRVRMARLHGGAGGAIDACKHARV